MISMSSSTRARKSWKSKVSVDDKPCTNSVYLSSTPHRNAQVLIEPCHTRDSIAVVSHQLPQSSKNEVNELNDWPRLIARQKPSRFTKKKRKEKKREPGELHHTHRPLDAHCYNVPEKTSTEAVRGRAASETSLGSNIALPSSIRERLHAWTPNAKQIA
jgi:hypothetical protein